MLKKIILLAALMLTGKAMVFSQNIRNQSVDALNNYVDYGNETIHALWPIYEGLMSFNGAINRFNLTGKGYISYENEDYLNITGNYEVLPKDIYQKCVLQSKILSPEDQKLLNRNLKSMKITLDNIQSNRDSIFIYVQEKQYQHDEKTSKAYRILTRLEILFNQYDLDKETLFRTIEKIYRKKYYPQNLKNSWVNSAILLRNGTEVCKNILDDLNMDDTLKIASYSIQLDSLIQFYKKTRDANLINLKSLGNNNGNDPYYRYDVTVDEMGAILAHCRHFLKSNWVAPYYKEYSKAYYYYNACVINKYNRYGLGLIQDYNRFIGLSDIKMMKLIEEPHQFKVLYISPQDKKESHGTKATDGAERPRE